MRKLIGAVVLAVALLWGQGVEAFETPKTVQDFLTQCQTKGSLNEIYCVGVFHGVGLVLRTNAKYHRQYAVCSKSFISFGQMQQAFYNWANANPKHWQADGGVGITTALIQTWPCK